ncbi:MAG: phosphoribosylglycinamide formyltransferase [candidate division KSB1 bacterium]|nr:phosphoribosylglycinamide formyltransferase [candidate division KSB1 bacterium]
MKKKSFAILISGYGRGAIDIINEYKNGLIGPSLELLLSSNNESYALNVAKQNGIKTETINKKNFQSKKAFEKEILSILKSNKIDYVFLAGWKYIIGDTILKEFNKRIVNIHNSLLPSFKGLKAIDQALEYGVKITGITTHLVDESLDGGKIIMQQAVNIDDDDDFKSVDMKVFRAGTIISIKTINKIFK